MISSPLKWVGGKSAILDKVIPHLKVGNKIVEPFMGSIVVSLNVNANEYILNDFNPDLVNFFQTAMAEPDRIAAYVSPYFATMTQEKYYELRDAFNGTPKNTFERACLFLIMNKFAFNGVCRYNKNGLFNVPYSSYKSVSVPNLTVVKNKFHNKKVTFTNLDFSDVSLYDGLKEGDVVYFDPPYLPSGDFDSNFSNYTGADFSLQQHIQLAKIANHLHHKGIRVVVSNHDTQSIRNLYVGSTYMLSVPKKRNISSQKEGRKTINELLVVYGDPVKTNSLFGD